MKISELIEDLESIKESWGDDIEVRLATQPNWPFEYAISMVCDVDLNELTDEEEADRDEYIVSLDEDEMAHPELMEDPEPNVVCYLYESYQIGYLPAQAAQAAGW